MYVCLCNMITDREFRVHAAQDDCTVSMVYRSLGTQPRCGKCVPYVKQLVQQVLEIPRAQPIAAVTG